MQMRHQAWILGQNLHEFPVDLHRVDRRHAKPVDFGDQFEYPGHQVSQFRILGQIIAPASNVDTGQNDLAISFCGQRFDLSDDGVCGDGSGIAAPVWNDAERASMVASVLNLDICSGIRIRAGRGRR